jgi:hypothetical protein
MGAPEMIFKPIAYLVQTVHLSCVEISTISKETEMSFYLTQWLRSSIVCAQNDFQAYGMFVLIYAPILCWDWHCLQMDWNELTLDPCHLGIPSGVPKTIFEPIGHLAQTMHLSCIKINTTSKQTKMSFPFDPRHLGVPSGAPKTILMPMVHSA